MATSLGTITGTCFSLSSEVTALTLEVLRSEESTSPILRAVTHQLKTELSFTQLSSLLIWAFVHFPQKFEGYSSKTGLSGKRLSDIHSQHKENTGHKNTGRSPRLTPAMHFSSCG